MNLRATLLAFSAFAILAAAQADELAPPGAWSGYQGGAAATPPMGWSSWNTFATNIAEDKIISIANGLVKSGLAAKGYRYVNMDDGW